MIYDFDTTDEVAALGALLLYATYRSRDRARYKTTPDMWAQIERFTKDAAKRARNLPQFIEALKPKLSCGTIHPRWMAVGETSVAKIVQINDQDGRLQGFVRPAPDRHQREYMVGLIERADAVAVIRRLYAETAWIVLLVRDRLEREKPVEAMLDKLASDGLELESED